MRVPDCGGMPHASGQHTPAPAPSPLPMVTPPAGMLSDNASARPPRHAVPPSGPAPTRARARAPPRSRPASRQTATATRRRKHDAGIDAWHAPDEGSAPINGIRARAMTRVWRTMATVQPAAVDSAGGDPLHGGAIPRCNAFLVMVAEIAHHPATGPHHVAHQRRVAGEQPAVEHGGLIARG